MTSGVFYPINWTGRLESRHIILLLYLIALLFFAPAKRALAQGGPPLITDDTATVEKGHWEINIATTIERRRDETEQEVPILDINYGLSKTLQLKYEVPYLRVTDEGERARTGLGNSNVGMRWRFFENESKGVAISTYPQLEFNNPTSSARRGLVDRGAQLLLPVEVTHKLFLFEANEEFGYLVKQHRTDELIYGLALGRHVSKRLELLGEIHGNALRNFKENELLFNLGGRYELTKHFTLLFSSGRSFRRASTGEPTLILYAGTQLSF
ncbi:MAG TPA: transporter [Pyrinomonadaceae bacterium]|nr:transporter [Pyrinomonadaceae bacterium]